MLKRRIRILAVTGITIMAAALVTLGATGARAASAAPAEAASHCVRIELQTTGLDIWDNGVGQPVALVNGAGSCWFLMHEFTIPGTSYHGYEYQDIRGHCLWDDVGIIETTGACSPGARGESFFGLNYYHGKGWIVTDKAYYLLGLRMALVGDLVLMAPRGTSAPDFWNFPS